MITLWILGLIYPALTRTAIIAEVVFALGLASGRLLSFALDGIPSLLLLIYLIIELVMGTWGLLILRQMNDPTTQNTL